MGSFLCDLCDDVLMCTGRPSFTKLRDKGNDLNQMEARCLEGEEEVLVCGECGTTGKF